MKMESLSLGTRCLGKRVIALLFTSKYLIITMAGQNAGEVWSFQPPKRANEMLDVKLYCVNPKLA